jgi:hypothetical protein
MQRRIERALFDAKHITRDVFEPARDAEAMLPAVRQRFEDQ